MTCAEWQAKMDAYVDAELPQDEQRAMADHLRTCAACSSQALAASQLKRSVHLAGTAFTPDAQFRERVASAVRLRPRRRWMPQFALALAAVVLLILGLSLWLRHRQNEHVIGELADMHIATLASATPVDVVSSDRHTVKPWFQGKVPFTFNLPELQNSPFVLVGGRMTYFDQSPGAELLFTVRKHTISVFIFKDSPALDHAFSSNGAARRLAFNLESWSDDGLRYIAVTDASRADVDDLRSRFDATPR